MRRLIINADDFGYTAGVNRAIVEAHTSGVVTSSTLMANGKAFADAVALAARMPQLSVGCHVLLIDGEPVLDANKLSTLAEKNPAQNKNVPHFRDGLKSFAVRAVAGSLNANEIEAEAAAQIRKIQSAEITVSHFDTHKHTHVFPKVWKPLLRAAKACGVSAVRNPFGPRGPLQSSQLLAQPSLWMRIAEVRILRSFARRFRASAEKHGFHTPDGTLGIEVTGVLDERLFLAIAENIPAGTWEFVCHPGYNDADLQSANTRLRESREVELNALTMPEARHILEKNGVELISYRELQTAI